MSEKSGFIRKIRTYLERNKLGDVLVLRGIISAADLKQHLFNQKASGLRLGEYLVANNIISKNQLAFALATQTSRIRLRCLRDVFTWLFDCRRVWRPSVLIVRLRLFSICSI